MMDIREEAGTFRAQIVLDPNGTKLPTIHLLTNDDH